MSLHGSRLHIIIIFLIRLQANNSLADFAVILVHMQCMSHTPLKLSSQKFQHVFVLLLLAASAVSCSYNNDTTAF